jgi:hypothetical protein
MEIKGDLLTPTFYWSAINLKRFRTLFGKSGRKFTFFLLCYSHCDVAQPKYSHNNEWRFSRVSEENSYNMFPFVLTFNSVAYLLKARTVELEEQPLLAKGSETTFVSRQRLDKHIPEATTEEMLETRVSAVAHVKELQGGQLGK